MKRVLHYLDREAIRVLRIFAYTAIYALAVLASALAVNGGMIHSASDVVLGTAGVIACLFAASALTPTTRTGDDDE
ncbi:hypothetical protein [Actinobaculum sp. 352]|uniref:hypothetical protein n=1 Tax=Actinobaculum sp. 352 TaxID=2490946 RepID=UPI000F7E1A34|nr:hypothetical protein [Actinobaculum sp. 352]RTE49615.1 hypothetical protein EKN07_06110 [Actinobaculum sp. 352]